MAQVIFRGVPDFSEVKAQIAGIKAEAATISSVTRSSGSGNVETRIQKQIAAVTGLDKATKSAAQSASVFEKAALSESGKIQQVTKAAEQATKQHHLLGDSIGNIALKMVAWQVMGRVVSAAIRAFTDAVETMKAVDDELVTVRKVTDATAEDLEKIEKQAYKTASAYGVAADEYLASVAEMARAGYETQSEDMAELAVKTQLVGDVSAETAQQFLISVDAAYQLNGSITELTKVLDGSNEIDNNYATSIEKIAEGLGKVAPIAAQAHVGVNELTAAIGTITAVTQRTGTEASTALRALFLNIVGDTKTEIDEGVTWTTGEIAGLRDVIKLYAKDAYDAAQATGSVINPMEAIAGLAQSMEDGLLTEQRLMEMVSDIGGKLRTSQLLALIQNWDMYQSMLGDYADAVGSADKEVGNAMDSWTRKTAVLKNSWTEFLTNFVNTDLVKGFLDAVSSGLQSMSNAMQNREELLKSTGDRLGEIKERLEKINEMPWYDRTDEINKELDALKREETQLEKNEKLLHKGSVNYAKNTLRRTGNSQIWNNPNDSIIVQKTTIENLAEGGYVPLADAVSYYTEQLQKNGKILEKDLSAYAQTVDVVNERISAYETLKGAGVELTEEQEAELASLNALTSATQMATGEGKKAVDEKIAALDELAKQNDITTQAQAELIAQQDIFNNQSLDVSQKIAALQALAAQAGVAASIISSLFNIGAMQNYVDAEMNAGKTNEQAVQGYWAMLKRQISGGTGVSSAGSYGEGSTGTGTGAGTGDSPALAALKARKLALQDEYDALTDAEKREDSLADLEEKRLAIAEKRLEVVKAENELLNAQRERKVRVYNAGTGQWDWVADQSEVSDAREALDTAKDNLEAAEKNLAAAEKDLRLQEKQNALLAQIKELEDQIANKDWTVKADANQTGGGTGTGGTVSSAPTGGGLSASQIKTLQTVYGVSADGIWGNQSAGASGFSSAGDAWKSAGFRNSYFRMYGKYPQEYDSGGILHGLGGIKATQEDEIVMPPEMTKNLLAPDADTRFRQRMVELGGLYGAGASPVSGIVNNKNSQDHYGDIITINGVQVGESAAGLTMADLVRYARTGLPLHNGRN